jgi:uncharacterized protein YbjQ (UPF0145 family)
MSQRSHLFGSLFQEDLHDFMEKLFVATQPFQSLCNIPENRAARRDILFVGLRTLANLCGIPPAESTGNSPNIAQGVMGGFKQMVGGNIESYAKVCEKAREEAFDRMVRHAEEVGADAVIAVRYDAAEFAPGVTEVLAYGTAVKTG